MTKTVDIEEVSNSLQAVISMTKNGDEVEVKVNGEVVAKVTHVEKPKIKQRIAGLGEGKEYYMSDDFDDELPDDFWGFDKEL